MLEQEEAWNLYYDSAIQEIDPQGVWELAEGVCRLLEVPLHNSWKTYLSELYKLPSTTVYITYLKLNYCIDDENLVDRVVQARYDDPCGIKNSFELSIADSAVPCSEEFKRKDEEPMEIDLLINFRITFI